MALATGAGTRTWTKVGLPEAFFVSF